MHQPVNIFLLSFGALQGALLCLLLLRQKSRRPAQVFLLLYLLTLLFYADALRQSARPGDAEPYYKKILTLEPQNKEALVKLAVIYYGQHNTAEAERCVATAVQSGPIDRNLYVQLGYALLVAGKNAEAATWYEKALAIAPNGLDYYNLTCAYAKNNDREKALGAMEKAIEFGFVSKNQFESDPDLNSIRSETRYKALLEKTQ